MTGTVSSKENVASQALLLIGEPVISSFDEDLSGTVGNTYERIVKAQISGPYKWRFCSQKQQLARTATPPINEWKYAYALPSDREIYLDAVFNSDSTGIAPVVGTRYEVFGQNLYTDEEKIYIDYRVRPVEAQWPAYFAQLIIYACAAEWAIPLTEDVQKGTLWHGVAFGRPEEAGQGGYSRTARTADARGGGQQSVQNFDLIAARAGWG